MTKIESILIFITKYNINLEINKELDAEAILNSLFTAFLSQKPNEKMYIIIDEYDHFANELLGFHTDQFKNLKEKLNKIRKWYEILKKGTESVVAIKDDLFLQFSYFSSNFFIYSSV